MEKNHSKVPVLFVDDEPNVLSAITRHLRRSFELTTATSGREALERITESGREFAVIVSDMRMPEMNGIEFLAQAQQRSPDSVRIMLTGNADIQTAIGAVNEGNVFRFLTKPCPPRDLLRAVIAALRQHRLLKAEKELLEQTLKGSVKVMAEVLSLIKPAAFGRATRVQALVSQIAQRLPVEEPWQLEIAALLSQIGCVVFPEETLQKVLTGGALSDEERRLLADHPQLGHDLVANIPRMEEVALSIKYQGACFNGSGGGSGGLSGEALPFGARVLKVTLDFDELTTQGKTDAEAMSTLRQREGWYDPEVVEALGEFVSQKLEANKAVLSVEQLRPGMVFTEDVRATNGTLLATRGTVVTRSLIARLQSWKPISGVREPIAVALGT